MTLTKGRTGPSVAESGRDPHNPSLLTGIRPNAVASVAIALIAAVITLFIIWLFIRPIALLLFGIIIAQALSPLVDRLQRWLPRSLAIAVVYLSLIGILGFMGWIIVPALVQQGQDLVERAPELYESAQTWLNQNAFLSGRISTEEIQARITGQIGALGSVLVNLPVIIISTLFEILLVVIISIYWIVAGPTLRTFLLSLFPYDRQGHAGSVLHEMGQTMGGYVRGIVLNATIIATIAFVGLTVIGVQYALVLALIAGVLDLVPIVGPIITTIPMVGIALLDSPTTALITLVFWISIQQFENYVLLPAVMNRQADIPALLVLLAVFVGGTTGGILGALIAIPLAGALRVFVLRVVAPAIRRWNGAIDNEFIGPPLPPQGQRGASSS